MVARLEAYVRRLDVRDLDPLKAARLIFGGTLGTLATLTLYQIAILAD